MTTKDKSYIADFLLAAGLFGVSTLMFVETLKLKPSPYEPLGPAALPRALSVALVLLAIPVIFQGIKKVRGRKTVTTEEATPVPEPELKAPPKGPQRPLLSLLTGITTVVYIFAIQWIGFRISSVVLLLFLGTMLYRREQKMRPVTFFPTLIVLAFGMSQLLYIVFTRVLVVNLP